MGFNSGFKGLKTILNYGRWNEIGRYLWLMYKWGTGRRKSHHLLQSNVGHNCKTHENNWFKRQSVPAEIRKCYLRNISVYHKVIKVKCILVQALRLCTGRTAYRGSRGITLAFHDHGTRRGWGVSVTPRPLFTPGKDPVSIVQEAGWAPGPVWTGAENLAPTGIRSPKRSARSAVAIPTALPGPFSSP